MTNFTIDFEVDNKKYSCLFSELGAEFLLQVKGLHPNFTVEFAISMGHNSHLYNSKYFIQYDCPLKVQQHLIALVEKFINNQTFL